MPVQVDEGGGALLKRLVTELGVSVRLGVSVQEIVPSHDRRLVAKLSDGVELDADVVVFSAGIRPQDTLARRIGLPIGERGGVLVNDFCRTVDDRIYAIGECAALAVGWTGTDLRPGRAGATRWAEVVADRLLGGANSTAKVTQGWTWTCRPSSSCSASTSPASVTHKLSLRARLRSWSTTRLPAPTRNLWSPTMRRLYSAACWSVTLLATRRCDHWSAPRCPPTR